VWSTPSRRRLASARRISARCSRNIIGRGAVSRNPVGTRKMLDQSPQRRRGSCGWCEPSRPRAARSRQLQTLRGTFSETSHWIEEEVDGKPWTNGNRNPWPSGLSEPG
jgi:hypothetical protein